jgi:uncharacterized protein (DUF2147 family)
MIAALLLLTAQGGAAPTGNILGEWINQHRTAIIRIDDCPSGLCGVVIWSAATARRDAARGGTAQLNGTTVMSGFVPVSQGVWRGRIFLPDRNRTLRAALALRGGELEVKGCELAELVCRKQTWSRTSSR